jgi:cold shock CspA family protein
MEISTIRQKGHVKFFNSIKGYGFIVPSNREQNEG